MLFTNKNKPKSIADGRNLTFSFPTDEELLSRSSIDLTDSATREFYRNKTVLITGGGGSIGSELSIKIAECSPKKLIILDINENNAFDIQQELLGAYGDELDLVIEIGSIQDKPRLDSIFAKHRPEIVFHAAAHKHVPMMEHCCAEAIKNNCIGTYNVCDAAEKYEVDKFILVSTDKAVNPTNVLGATKRICEMIVESRNDSKTSFCAVRFGNVLGSAGSVIPLFKKQIAKGGPVTVTDKRAVRYFMTISEAACLLMQAGVKASRGELFVLNTGMPIRIYDLAMRMIKLSGLIPYVDIDVKIIGLRPGEKLYEELLIKSETLTRTENDMIFIEKDTPNTRAEIDGMMSTLTERVKMTDEGSSQEVIKDALKSIIISYRSPSEVNDVCHIPIHTE